MLESTKAVLLEQKAMVDSLIKAYEDYCYFNIGRANQKADPSIDALVMSNLERHISSAQAGKSFAKKFQPLASVNNISSSQSSDKNDSGFGWNKNVNKVLEDRLEQSTAGRMINAAKNPNSEDQVFDAVMAFVDDCFPCLKRTLNNIANIDIGTDMKNALLGDINQRLAVLNNILGLIQSDDVYRDICSLLNFLSFICIPDLAGLIAALTALVAKLTDALKFDINVALWGALSGIFRISLGQLEALLKKYFDILVAPLECVIDSINYQIAKIPGEQAKKASQDLSEFKSWAINGSSSVVDNTGRTTNLPEWKGLRPGFNEKVIGNTKPYDPIDGKKLNQVNGDVTQFPTDGSPAEADKLGLVPPSPNALKDYNGIVGSLEDSLQYLSYYTTAAVKYITDKLAALQKYIQEVIGIDSSGSGAQIGAFADIRRITRLISVVRVLMELLSKGSHFCTGSNVGQTPYYLNSISPLIVGKDPYWNVIKDSNDNIVILNPEMSRNPDTYKYYGLDPSLYLTKNSANIPASTVDGSILSYKPVAKSFSMESCLKKVSYGDSNEIQKWIEKLNNEVVVI